MLENKCANCGLPISKNKKYCNNKCQHQLQRKFSREERLCPICNKIYEVTKISKQITCGFECSKLYNQLPENKKLRLDKVKKTNLERYGVEYPFQNKDIQDKIDTSNIDYNIVTQKIKQTKFEKYGDQHYNNKEQNKETKKERYNDENYNNREKYKETCLDNFGVENLFQLDEIKEKSKQTKIAKYNDENYNNIEKRIDTNLEKYGVTSYSKTDEFKEKIKMTSLDRYGVDNPSKNDDIKDKIVKTKLDRYGYGYYNGPKHRTRSVAEKYVCEQLNGESGFMYLGREFDIKVEDNIYEVDGDFWHPIYCLNISMRELTSYINDFRKINLIKDSEYTLYKVHISQLPEVITEESLQENSYLPDYNFSFSDIIVNKEYLIRYIEQKGIDKLIKYRSIFYNFIKTFSFKFSNHELETIVNDKKLFALIFNYMIGNNEIGTVYDFSFENIIKIYFELTK